MTSPGGQIKANAAQMTTLANMMDDTSHRMQAVLDRYQHANQEAIATQTMGGHAAMTSVATGAEIHDAQQKIQMRFQMVNDTLRGGAGQYSNMDADNASAIANVAGHISFQ